MCLSAVQSGTGCRSRYHVPFSCRTTALTASTVSVIGSYVLDACKFPRHCCCLCVLSRHAPPNRDWQTNMHLILYTGGCWKGWVLLKGNVICKDTTPTSPYIHFQFTVCNFRTLVWKTNMRNYNVQSIMSVKTLIIIDFVLCIFFFVHGKSWTNNFTLNTTWLKTSNQDM